MFSEGVILPQRLRFCRSFVNDGTNLNLLWFVAFSELRLRIRLSRSEMIHLEIM